MVIMPQSGLWIADWNKITRIITLIHKRETQERSLELVYGSGDGR